MKVGIIGTGNVAWFMAKRLFDYGHKIVGICGRNLKEAERLADEVEAYAAGSFDDMMGVASAYIFALPDGVVKQEMLRFPFRDKVLVHCSGTLSANPSEAMDAGVAWPLFSINKNDLPTREDIPVFWEGNSPLARRTVTELAVSVSNNVRMANFDQRQQLHLSAVIVNNFVNHLMTIAQARTQQTQMLFNQSLRPIIEETLEIAFRGESKSHQTGPAVRNDLQTMQRHLELLNGHPEWQAIYKAISQSIFKGANSGGG